MTFSNTEKRIINLMFNSPYFLTTSEISHRLGISWVTANQYLKGLERKGYVAGQIEGASIRWRLIKMGESKPPPLKVKRIKGRWRGE